jgi:hypothetical protein
LALMSGFATRYPVGHKTLLSGFLFYKKVKDIGQLEHTYSHISASSTVVTSWPLPPKSHLHHSGTASNYNLTSEQISRYPYPLPSHVSIRSNRFILQSRTSLTRISPYTKTRTLRPLVLEVPREFAPPVRIYQSILLDPARNAYLI